MNIFKSIIVGLIVLGIFYFAIAFNLWELNPGAWPQNSRSLLAVLGLFCALFAAGFVYMTKEKN